MSTISLPEIARGKKRFKIAVFRASRIGDFVCAIPAFRALRNALPQAEITLIALPLLRELAARCPYLDNFLPFPGIPGIAEQFYEPGKTSAFIAAAQSENFDAALQMHGSGVYSNPFTLLLGARFNAGMIRPGDGAGRLDVAVPIDEKEPEVFRWLRFLAVLGIPNQGRHTELRLTEADRAHAAILARALPRPLIGVHPGSREDGKCWPKENYVRLLGSLHGTARSCLLFGLPEEYETVEWIASRSPLPCINLAGQTNLPVLAALVGMLDLLLANDSALAHFAYALRVPSITIFTATDPARWAPAGDTRHVLFHAKKEELVVEAAAAALLLLQEQCAFKSGGTIPHASCLQYPSSPPSMPEELRRERS